MLGPDQSEVDNIYEVRFKNTRKGFYRNVNGLRLYIGDHVVLESDRGYDVGTLSLGGIMAELQMKKKNGGKIPQDIPRIYRKANEADVELLKEVRGREKETLARTREVVQELKLDMKLSDVEYQGDNTKAIFYYIADHRVDFRELIKILAREFHIRVEMKQIGLRHEAGLVGGIGSCGRELCCSTWLTEFKTVSTSAARYQNLSLNPMKISGLCGRLKCCLNFELDAYMDALRDFPKIERIETMKGPAFLQKTDIFKGLMWFSYANETTWYTLPVEEVKRISAMNAAGQKPDGLTVGDGVATLPPPASNKDEFDFVDVVGTNIPEVEKSTRKRGGGNRRGKSKGKGRGGSADAQKEQSNNPENLGTTPETSAPQNRGRQQQRNPSQQRRNQQGPRKEQQLDPKGESQQPQDLASPQSQSRPRNNQRRNQGKPKDLNRPNNQPQNQPQNQQQRQLSQPKAEQRPSAVKQEGAAPVGDQQQQQRRRKSNNKRRRPQPKTPKQDPT
ncbi:MAG: regulatory iron-sulfur-containing complex subunit RicT [Bacteroidia bacterium]